ncbi:MAG: rod shape-determining protein MreC, partial [Flavobacteriaceae bacterium]|nr:rod shape-determining protein MreC [Flavobacteriaceae bacterium]
STIFPPGILIGKVARFNRDEGDDYYKIDVELFSDMTSLKHVYLVRRRDAAEIKQLEKVVEDVEE